MPRPHPSADRTDDRWIRIHPTLVFAGRGCSFSSGLVLGGRWAYGVLGWGGYWGWDPVEIAAFMPWLTGTAFTFCRDPGSAVCSAVGRDSVILTYSLVIFGTFDALACSPPVHAQFGEQPNRTILLMGFVSTHVGFLCGLVIGVGLNYAVKPK
ncbi:MAG: cytochrome c biogenesis protein CcsA [Anaerolineales bacterium]|nr:cytochrome c biogenesis protein CcsA [Anaerolineales bacterium]